MRLDRPRSAGKRVRAIRPSTPSTRDEALVAEDLADLLDGRVRAWQDQLGGTDVVGGQLPADRADARQQRLQGGLELPLVAGVDRLGEVVVQTVQLPHVLVWHLELP